MQIIFTRSFYTILILSCLSFSLTGQDAIIFNNGLEDTPRRGTVPMRSVDGWLDCGVGKFPNESPPDIHPNDFWKVNLKPAQGKSYVGLVVRENETYESISQRLDVPLKKGQCYTFNIYLTRSDNYWSGTTDLDGNKSATEENYITPAVFRLWGGKVYCGQGQLLAESDPVENNDWIKYEFEIKPQTEINFITYEAFYVTPNYFPYNGHILIDEASNFIEIDCETKEEKNTEKEPIVAVLEEPIEKETVDEKEEEIVSPPVVVNKPKEEYKEPKIMTELRNPEKLKAGQKIRLKNLYFQADTSTINKSSYGVLKELSSFLKHNTNFVVELGGHTNNIPEDEYCDDLSRKRARQVYKFLVESGVDRDQLSFKGYGKKQPIASNETTVGRARNQRVEIKIISK